ncbi:MAG: ATP-binding cassette domain-containing protein [Thiopseudomonas sp.]
MCSEPLLQLNRLSLSSAGNPRLHDINLSIRHNQILAIVGRSGAGKSSLLKTLMGLVEGQLQGELLWHGQPLNQKQLANMRGQHIALLPQGLSDALNPHMSVLDSVVETLRLHRTLSGRAARRLAAEALEQGAVPTHLHQRLPRHLSGGEVQRVLWVLANLHQPQLLLLDEPTAALDPQRKARLAHHLRQSKNGAAIVIISHDLDWIEQLADRVLVLDQGCIVEDLACREFFTRATHPASQQLLKARCPLTVDTVVSGTPLVRIQQLGQSFANKTLFAHLDWTIYTAQRWVINGSSGAGKSTLARLLAGWATPQQGQIEWLEQPQGCLARQVALIPQHPYASFASRQTVADILSEPLLLQGQKQQQSELLQRLDSVRLPATSEFLRRYPHSLSGGEQQRLALARALCLLPRLLIADESTSALDSLSRQTFLQVLLSLQHTHGFALVMISHELDMADELQAQVLTLG